MKRIITFLGISILFVFSMLPYNLSAGLIPKFDERVELISTVCRLANFKEYSKAKDREYINEIDSRFSSFRNHPVVAYAKELRENYSVAYDAWMNLAVHLEIKDGEIRFNPELEKQMLIENESRWQESTIDEFINKLNDFYQISNFSDFYNIHTDYFVQLEKKFQDVLNKTDTEWFERFFGDKPHEFRIILSAINHSDNYGVKTIDKDNNEIPHAVIAVVTDSDGNIPYEKGVINLIMHEFAHSFCNPLIYKWYDDLSESGEIIYPPLDEIMRKQAYPQWKIVLCEALVRACVIIYMNQDSYFEEKDVANQIRYESERGFYWIKLLVAQMMRYDNQRDKYPTFDDYMPQIVSLYDNLAQIIIRDLFPKVDHCSIQNGSKINSEDTELIITFNRPMNNRYSIGYGAGGVNEFPEMQPEWTNETTLKITMKLLPGKKYSFRFIPGFESREGLPLVEKFELEFETE